MIKQVYRGMLVQLIQIADGCEGCEYERETRTVLEDARVTILRDIKNNKIERCKGKIKCTEK